ncbi:MAG: cyclic nucleotide-binding domain-containing protein [Clostridiales bacterium]|nr:cyclic nucleotide-binding domain-containing protein [Clostridiales bacterium]
MDIDTALLRRTGLFQGMEDGDIQRLLDCLHCPMRRYGRGEFLWHAGDAVPMAGIVLEGCVDAVQYGEDGGAVLTDEARQMLTAYDAYCEKLRAYGVTLFEETFAFYNDIPKHELHRKEKTHD